MSGVEAGISVVVVTGASGFIGSHIVKACLERGFKVHGCVRDKDAPKNKFLADLAEGTPGSIELFSADLVTDGAYDAACSGAQAVIHAAAQVDPTVIKDPWKDMVEPSTRGVANILSSVNKNKGMLAFIQTSSVASVGFREDRLITEADWSTTSIEENPYTFAKRKGEEAVWEMTRGKPYKVAAINPTMVFGPVLAKPHCKASPFVFRQLIYGNPLLNIPYSVVDVRDVAKAHVEAMIRPEASGKRFILDGDEAPMTVSDITAKCRELFPSIQFGTKDQSGDDQIFEGGGMRSSDKSVTDNTLSRRVLGLSYISSEQTIKDTVASMVDSGYVKTKTASKL